MLTRNLIRISVRYYSISSTTTTTLSAPTPLTTRKKLITVKQTAEQDFVDRKGVECQGGKGGDGCIAFMRLYENEFGGPSGGDGGNGGHIFFTASSKVSSLSHLSSILNAVDGNKGQVDNMTGANAPHKLVDVPLGTFVKKDGKTIAEMLKEGEVFLAARGGSGGKGNRFFASDTNQSPEICEYGAEGEKQNYFLEMSIIADVGFVGFPNAGKSTLLRSLSRARPRIAPHPFTTLKPQIGVVTFSNGRRVVLADLPGLIEGANLGRGLGAAFLRHVNRTRLLAFVLDLDYDVVQQLEQLENEVYAYDSSLVHKKRLILLNKSDLVDESNHDIEIGKEGDVILYTSSKYGIGLENLLKKFYELVYGDDFTDLGDSQSDDVSNSNDVDNKRSYWR